MQACIFFVTEVRGYLGTQYDVEQCQMKTCEQILSIAIQSTLYRTRTDVKN